MSDAKPRAVNLPLAHRPDKRKQSLYFPEQMLQEIQEEAARQDRSLSWIMQRSWELAREDLKTWPTHRDARQ